MININELKRKYGGTIESIIEHRTKLELLLENSHDLDSLIKKKNKNKNIIKDKLNIIGLDLFP